VSEKRDDEREAAREGAAAAPARVGRRFGDEEIRGILGRAADLQERSYAITRDTERGLTLEELRQVAEEAGIDPIFVDLAARDVDAPVERRESALAGGTYQWHFRTSIPGEVRDADRDRIVHAIRSTMGQKGEIADVYGRMEWSFDDSLGPVIIGIVARGGRTEIDVTAARGQEAGLLHGMGVPMGGLGGGAALAGAIGVTGPAVLPLIAAAAAVSYGLVRTGWGLRSRWWERRLRRLVDRIASVVQEVAALPPPEERG
jgi:hypothetical protein